MRRRVDSALGSGNAEELRRQSVLALEELCAADYFVRIGMRREDNQVVAEYKKKRGRYQLSVELPADEWREFVDTADEDPPLPPSTPRTAATNSSKTALVPESAALSPQMVDYLPDIVRTFSVLDRANPVLSRLELLVGTLKRWLSFSAAKLYLLEDIVGTTEVVGELLETVTADQLREDDVYRACIESGSGRILPSGEAAAVLTGDTPALWDFVGIAPIFALGKVCGILKIFFEPDIDDATRKIRLDTAVNLVKQIVEFSSHIENITSIDALTQVYNRHFYDTQVSVEIERAKRSGNEVSMLVIDLDDFKKINDEMGHKKGDEALSVVADLIRKNLRKVDSPFRYGGEEFVILLPGTSEFESVHTAERLRRVIAQHTGFRDLHGNTKTITVSIGVSVYPQTAGSADDLFNQADAAMYRAKQLGKNRVVLYKADMKMS